MTNPGHSLELSIVNYLSGSTQSTSSLLSGSTATFACGYTNIDKLAVPFVVVDCNEYNELYFNTRNYEFLTRVFIYEIAADTDINTLGTLSEAVLNEFDNSTTAVINFTNPQTYNIAVWQCQIVSKRSEVSGDALLTEATYRIIGALVPSS